MVKEILDIIEIKTKDKVLTGCLVDKGGNKEFIFVTKVDGNEYTHKFSLEGGFLMFCAFVRLTSGSDEIKELISGLEKKFETGEYDFQIKG